MYVEFSVTYRDSLQYLNTLLIFQLGGQVTLPEVRPIKESAFLVPFDQDKKFVGRSTVIQDIDDRIKTQYGNKITHRVALCGIGGIG